MNILIVHNKYQIKGGEDVVCEAERKMLEQKGHLVKVAIFDNNSIHATRDKLKALAGIVSNKASRRRLHADIESFLPDIVHVHNFFPLVSPVVFELAYELKIPTVFTLHNYRLICPGALLLRDERICEECTEKKFATSAIINKCYRNSSVETAALAFMNYWHNKNGTWISKVSKYIVLTEFAKTRFLNSALDLDEDKIMVKPNFVADEGVGVARTERFLFVGRLSQEKGVKILLQAFKKTDYKLDIIGEGALENLVRDAEKENKNIKYLGVQDKDVVIEKMKTCRALIFPSIWYEGMPMTILEALSCGCPVIASNIGAMQNLIKDDVNGLHFISGDASDLRSKLEKVTPAMGEMARESYLQQFTQEKNYELLISIYHQAISSESDSKRK